MEKPRVQNLIELYIKHLSSSNEFIFWIDGLMNLTLRKWFSNAPAGTVGITQVFQVYELQSLAT